MDHLLSDDSTGGYVSDTVDHASVSSTQLGDLLKILLAFQLSQLFLLRKEKFQPFPLFLVNIRYDEVLDGNVEVRLVVGGGMRVSEHGQWRPHDVARLQGLPVRLQLLRVGWQGQR